MSNLINVDLYGQGTRNSRLRAEYVYCDHAGECSAYQNGKCFCVTVLFGVECPFGRVGRIDGGTKQSKAYWQVRDNAKKNECYNKLEYPRNNLITRIGDKAFLTITHIRVEQSDSGEIWCKDPMLGNNKLMVDIEALTPPNLMKICSFRPQAFMGGEIEKYQKEVVPKFLYQLSKLFPDEYKAFREAYPEYEASTPNFVGMTAKISTCSKECEYRSNGNWFRVEDGYLVCSNYSGSLFMPFGAKEGELRIKLSDDLKVTITNNQQVTEETEFV